jgi:hypothetical protein
MEATHLIDISMFNNDYLKLSLFQMLVNNSTSQTNFITTDMDLTQYEMALRCINNGYIDRFNGRVIKADLRGPTLDGRLYNRDNGNGAAERIVKFIRDIAKL